MGARMKARAAGVKRLAKTSRRAVHMASSSDRLLPGVPLLFSLSAQPVPESGPSTVTLLAWEERSGCSPAKSRFSTRGTACSSVAFVPHKKAARHIPGNDTIAFRRSREVMKHRSTLSAAICGQIVFSGSGGPHRVILFKGQREGRRVQTLASLHISPGAEEIKGT